jgi:hypothetical protein
MSENTFVNSIPKQALEDICPPPNAYYTEGELMKLYENGIGSDKLLPDDSTGRIPVSQLDAHVRALEGSRILKPRPTKRVGETMETDMAVLIQNDRDLYENVQKEYCYYEQRYRYALKTFLSKATSRNTSDNSAAQVMLGNTKILNRRVNSVLELMNYLAQGRVDITNSNKTDINSINSKINNKLDKLSSAYSMLNRDNAIVLTQKESVRYTEEKNNYTSNQISLWASLNVLALATIFYVYRA